MKHTLFLPSDDVTFEVGTEMHSPDDGATWYFGPSAEKPGAEYPRATVVSVDVENGTVCIDAGPAPRKPKPREWTKVADLPTAPTQAVPPGVDRTAWRKLKRMYHRAAHKGDEPGARAVLRIMAAVANGELT